MVRRIVWLMCLVVALLTSCKKEDSAYNYNLKVNQFIWETLDDIYLWDKELPKVKIDNTPPKQFYQQLLYKDDKWSYITDNAQALTNSLAGIETTFGYQLAFYRTTSNSNEYFAVVEYVNTNTPAAKAGVRRGDYFVRIDGEKITASNYRKLLSGTTIELTRAVLSDGNIVETTQKVSLTAQQLTINPVLHTSIIERNGIKIGYMVYTAYVGELNSHLEQAIAQFKQAGVTEFVLDLRFNGGGDEVASTYLCSCLAPQAVVDAKKVIVYNRWNDKYDAYWRKHGASNRIERRFEQVPYNLDLKQLYVLTSHSTASASELTIIGLMPYMRVTKIGDTTYGKYTSMVLLQPKDNDIDNWALLPIVAKYTNSQGYTDFKDGLSADYAVNDNLFPAKQLGDESEPLLAKALSLIAGDEGVQKIASQQMHSANFDYVTTLKSEVDDMRNNLYLTIEN